MAVAQFATNAGGMTPEEIHNIRTTDQRQLQADMRAEAEMRAEKVRSESRLS